MLKRIYCDKFLQKEIIFHEGFNAIVGDNIASNSIGKSTILMIIDFVFGGEQYIKKNHDVVDNLGHHDFKFSFEFDNKTLYFMRTTNEYKFVYRCNENYIPEKKIKINEYTKLLQVYYLCELEDLSFRNIVGRYFRIYGKENLNERKPIQYFEKEKEKDSILILLKLFDKYSSIKEFQEQITILTKEKDVLLRAAKTNLIPNVTKTLFNKNEKKIKELDTQLEKLKEDTISSHTKIEELISKEVISLRKEKNLLLSKKNVLITRLYRIQMNIKNENINIHPELKQLVTYFPNFNVEQARKVDSFHSSITRILKSELKASKKEIDSQISEIELLISEIDKKIASKLTIENIPTLAVNKIVEVATYIKQLQDENGYFTKKINLDKNIDSAKKTLDNLKEKSLDEVSNQINIKIYDLNKEIYTQERKSPNLNIHGDKYSFTTYGDTGTGTAFANLITFDLALLELTCLPAIAHDLPLLKNIENSALENIVNLYNKNRKQIFVAIDKMSSYSEKTRKIVERCKVLELSKDKLLFTMNWKNRE